MKRIKTVCIAVAVVLVWSLFALLAKPVVYLFWGAEYASLLNWYDIGWMKEHSHAEIVEEFGPFDFVGVGCSGYLLWKELGITTDGEIVSVVFGGELAVHPEGSRHFLITDWHYYAVSLLVLLILSGGLFLIYRYKGRAGGTLGKVEPSQTGIFENP